MAGGAALAELLRGGDGVSMQTKEAYKRATGESFIPSKEAAGAPAAATHRESTQTVDQEAAKRTIAKQKASDQERIKQKALEKAKPKTKCYGSCREE